MFRDRLILAVWLVSHVWFVYAADTPGPTFLEPGILCTRGDLVEPLAWLREWNPGRCSSHQGNGQKGRYTLPFDIISTVIAAFLMPSQSVQAQLRGFLSLRPIDQLSQEAVTLVSGLCGARVTFWPLAFSCDLGDSEDLFDIAHDGSSADPTDVATICTLFCIGYNGSSLNPTDVATACNAYRNERDAFKRWQERGTIIGWAGKSDFSCTQQTIAVPGRVFFGNKINLDNRLISLPGHKIQISTRKHTLADFQYYEISMPSQAKRLTPYGYIKLAAILQTGFYPVNSATGRAFPWNKELSRELLDNFSSVVAAVAGRKIRPVMSLEGMSLEEARRIVAHARCACDRKKMFGSLLHPEEAEKIRIRRLHNALKKEREKMFGSLLPAGKTSMQQQESSRRKLLKQAKIVFNRAQLAEKHSQAQADMSKMFGSLLRRK